MTFNSFYNGITQNAIYGGVAAAIIIFLLFNKANKVAASGSKAKMAGWSMAPSIMVIVAVLAHGVALNVVWPRVQGAFASTPVQNTVALGDALTASLDNVLWSGGGELMAGSAGAAAFKSPVTEASTGPLVNGGQTASFVGQPVTIQASTERTVQTAAQAVNVITNIAATATPIGGGMAYINQFIADNKPVDTTIACNGSYTVKSGDSLAKIAKACYGDSNKWVELCKANGLSDCNNIKRGMLLTIPAGGNNLPTSAIVNSQAPASYGQQSATYTTRPTPAPVYASQNAQQAAAPVRNASNGQVVIASNAAAVQAVQALGPLPTVAPVVAVAPTPTPRAAYILTEVLAKPAAGGGQAYIDQFLKTQADTTVASGQ